MPITFDSLEELKAFCRNFRLSEGEALRGSLPAPEAEVESSEKRKPGRPPKAEKPAAAKAAVKKATRTVKAEPQKAKTGRALQLAPVPAKSRRGVKAVNGKAAAAEKTSGRSKGRPKAEGTLTSKIQDTIQNFVDNRREFTANDIYMDLSKREKQVNKQSVITSVLKQMNTTFATIPVEERPGAGPRPVKVYMPA